MLLIGGPKDGMYYALPQDRNVLEFAEPSKEHLDLTFRPPRKNEPIPQFRFTAHKYFRTRLTFGNAGTHVLAYEGTNDNLMVERIIRALDPACGSETQRLKIQRDVAINLLHREDQYGRKRLSGEYQYLCKKALFEAGLEGPQPT